MEPSKNHSLAQSFRHAFDGFVCCLRDERNMKIHCAMTVIVAVCAFVFGLGTLEKAALFILCGLVIAAELFNTAIENAVNLASPEINPYAKLAKDAAAAAVLIISVISAVVGIIIFWPSGMMILDWIQHMI